MQDGEQLSLEQIQTLLEASEGLRFQGKQRQEVYDWMTRLMRQQGYRKQGKVARGLLRRYMAKMTGRSRAQVTRLIGRYLKNSEVKEAVYIRNRFQCRFTQADIELLAKVDGCAEIRNSRRRTIGHPADPVSNDFSAGEFRAFTNPSVWVKRERLHLVIVLTQF